MYDELAKADSYNEQILIMKENECKKLLHQSIFKDIKEQSYKGSGFFLSKNISLTAAHNIYDR